MCTAELQLSHTPGRLSPRLRQQMQCTKVIAYHTDAVSATYYPFGSPWLCMYLTWQDLAPSILAHLPRVYLPVRRACEDKPLKAVASCKHHRLQFGRPCALPAPTVTANVFRTIVLVLTYCQTTRRLHPSVSVLLPRRLRGSGYMTDGPTTASSNYTADSTSPSR